MIEKLKVTIMICVALMAATACAPVTSGEATPMVGTSFSNNAIRATGRAKLDGYPDSYKMALIDAIVSAEEALVGVKILSQTSVKKELLSKTGNHSYKHSIKEFTTKELAGVTPFHYEIVDERKMSDGTVFVTIEVSLEGIAKAHRMNDMVSLAEGGISAIRCIASVEATLCDTVANRVIQRYVENQIRVNRSSEYWAGFRTNTNIEIEGTCDMDQVGQMIFGKQSNDCQVTLTVQGYLVLGKSDMIVRQYPTGNVVCALSKGVNFDVSEGFPIIHDEREQAACLQKIEKMANSSIDAFVTKTLTY